VDFSFLFAWSLYITKMMSEKEIIASLFKKAGIEINGDQPGDIQVHNDALYSRVLRGGSLALGEAYMDEWWDAAELDTFFYLVLQADLPDQLKRDWKTALQIGKQLLLNPQRRSKAYQVGEQHYDIGNDLYQAMLDNHMTYTCGYWENAANLNEAQEVKLDLVCRKIGLKKDQTVLDIGCGWGSWAIYAARHYGAKVVGVTVSKEQAELGQKRAAGLPVEILLQDYREVKGKFDHLVSLGMFEHVGLRNYHRYFKVAKNLLSDDGVFLLHTIGSNVSSKTGDPWLKKYIFPNSMLPSISQIGRAIEHKFVMEDWHNFGADYDKTLMSWQKNIQDNWHSLKANYNNRFYRIWHYYLSSTAGAFRARHIQLWQVVLSKRGIPGGYKRIR